MKALSVLVVTLFLPMVMMLGGCSGGESGTADVPSGASVASSATGTTARDAATSQETVADNATRGLTSGSPSTTTGSAIPKDATLSVPAVGSNVLRILSPSVIELQYINTQPAGGVPSDWNFVSGGTLTLPASSKFTVTVNGQAVAISGMGFKRRALFAPDRTRDLRIGNYLYMKLASNVPDGATVQVTNPDQTIWPSSRQWVAKADPVRWSPVIHANQEGYVPTLAKKAQVGYYLGSMGELAIPGTTFQLVDDNGTVVFTGTMTQRPEQGSAQSPAPYQQVYQADFSSFTNQGRYRLQVAGLGTSYPFLINDAVAANFTRAYALGLLHKRCGAALSLPFTRFVHAACHSTLLYIPTLDAMFNATNSFLSSAANSYVDSYQTAQRMVNVAASLFPFMRSGQFDGHGGHHDAGDYSKYTIDSIEQTHVLTFAVDNIPGVAGLDNLGLPESGDGKSDVLQLAKWEADYLCRIQDTDGGFSFIVYPRDLKYEWDTIPSNKYPQVAWPKNTMATAGAVAALAQMATSPTFKAQFPTEAAQYLAAAKKGWQFLQNGWAKYGRQGAYQTETFYGMESHDWDEIVWAEVEMYIATGDPAIHQMVLADLKPGTTQRRWGWWRLFEAYGCAMRDYAFAAKSGRVATSALDPTLLAACQNEVIGAGQDQVNYANASSYNVSYASADKRYGNASWYLPADRAFDMAVAYQLQPSPALLDAIVGNANYEHGSNPVNQTFVTGLGWKRQREMVDQFSKNDRRVLPTSGVGLGAIGNIQPLLGGTYSNELRTLSYPPDTQNGAGYSMYDRFTDTWDVQREMVTFLQARALCSMAFLMTQTPYTGQAWKSAPATISMSASAAVNTPVTATLSVPGQDLSTAQRIVWEAAGQEPTFGGPTCTYTPTATGAGWIEAEVQWPDGRRAFAALDFTVGTTSTPSPSPTVTSSPSPSPTVTSSPSPSPTVTSSPSPSPTVTSSPTPSPTVTSSPSPSPTVTSSPTPSPTSTGSTGVSVSFTYPVNGNVTSVGSGNVGISSWGIAASVPYNQGKFVVNNTTTAYASLKVGQYVSCTVTPFSGRATAASGMRITYASPNGALSVPAQTLSATTQQATMVLVSINGSIRTMSLYNALRTSGVSIVGVPTTSTPSPTATATSSPSPSPTQTGSNKSVPVSFASTVSGSITQLGSGGVGISSYGIAAWVPYYQGKFVVNGTTMAYANLRVGQYVNCTVTTFTGPVVSASGMTIKLGSPQGTVTVPAQTLSAATQQAIWVNVKLSNGTTTTMSLYQALKTSGATVVSAVP